MEVVSENISHVNFKELDDENLSDTSGAFSDEKKKSSEESGFQKHTVSSMNNARRKDEYEETEAERSARLASKGPVKVSEHLLHPTVSNIISKQTFLDKKDKMVDGELDIWQKNSPRNDILNKIGTKYEHVQSRLLTPTVAHVSSKVALLEKDKVEEDIDATSKNIKPINPNSHVLKSTSALVNGSWTRKENDMINQMASKPEVSELRMLSLQTGPKQVESRLYEITSSVKNSEWKPKEYYEAEEELRKEEELAAKANQKKVTRVSDRLLLPTAANENARYQKTLEDQTEGSTVSSGRNKIRVRATSPRLLALTAALENAKYKSKDESCILPSKIDRLLSPAKIPDRLLASTVAYEKAKYQKPTGDIDPRELGWKQPTPKAKVKDVDTSSVITSRSKASNAKKVKETSNRVLMLTAAHQQHRRASPEGSIISRALSGRPQSANRALSASRALSCTESFLQHTFSSSRALEKPKSGNYLLSNSSKALLSPVADALSHSDLLSLAKVYRPEIEKKYKEVPASLLAPTASYRMKGLPDNLSDLSEGSFEDEPKLPADRIRPVSNTENFLAPTTSSRLHFAAEEQKAKAPSKPVTSMERFMSPTKASSTRFAPDPVPAAPKPKLQKRVSTGDIPSRESKEMFSSENSAKNQYLQTIHESTVSSSAKKAARKSDSPRLLTRRESFANDTESSKEKVRDSSVAQRTKEVSVKKLVAKYSSSNTRQ